MIAGPIIFVFELRVEGFAGERMREPVPGRAESLCAP